MESLIELHGGGVRVDYRQISFLVLILACSSPARARYRCPYAIETDFWQAWREAIEKRVVAEDRVGDIERDLKKAVAVRDRLRSGVRSGATRDYDMREAEWNVLDNTSLVDEAKGAAESASSQESILKMKSACDTESPRARRRLAALYARLWHGRVGEANARLARAQGRLDFEKTQNTLLLGLLERGSTSERAVLESNARVKDAESNFELATVRARLAGKSFSAAKARE